MFCKSLEKMCEEIIFFNIKKSVLKLLKLKKIVPYFNQYTITGFKNLKALQNFVKPWCTRKAFCWSQSPNKILRASN